MNAQINRKKLSSGEVRGCNIASSRIYIILFMVMKDTQLAKTLSPYSSKTSHHIN